MKCLSIFLGLLFCTLKSLSLIAQNNYILFISSYVVIILDQKPLKSLFVPTFINKGSC